MSDNGLSFIPGSQEAGENGLLRVVFTHTQILKKKFKSANQNLGCSSVVIELA